MSEYSAQELMVAVASREIRDGDLVFVGMRLPILAYAVARNSHAPAARRSTGSATSTRPTSAIQAGRG